nr:MAG TPA: hypothetical protein [Herelleviridae sp.]
MENKKVVGVLKYNIDTRNSMLLKNEGKYSLYDGLLSPSIGEAYQKRDLYPHSQTNDKSILDFTHDNLSDYSKKISQQNFSNSKERDVFSILAPTNDQLQRWGGNYNNYLEYVSEAYGKELTSVNFVERTLAAQDVIYGLRMMEVGVVKDINVSNALAGVVTTNINNFSGTDTKLGLITNEMYAASLYVASQFNSSRKRYDTTSQYPYITPYLYEAYGNNSANVNRLSDIMRPDSVFGRFLEDISVDANIIHDWNDPNYTTEKNSALFYANLQTEENKYQPSTGKDYLSYLDKPEKDRTIIYNNDKDVRKATTYEYDEGDTAHSGKFIDESEENSQNNYKVYEEGERSEGTLLEKTHKLFTRYRINTLISRFHTSNEYNEKYKGESFDTAKSAFGKSKGRNLLKLGANPNVDNFKTNNYSNPYCRVWTYHHEYDRLSRMIRPFITEENGQEMGYSFTDLQKLNEKFRSTNTKGITNGGDYLAEKTVLNKSNGLVDIVPSTEGKVKIQKCMFSIENLAWKDVPNMSKYLSEEQRGPFGGRIMWFPPYDLRFNESVNVDWNANTFIGRGEKVYTYTNTDRTASLDFTILIDHPAIINEIQNMKGKAPDDDIEMDTLRFFAGCGPLNNDLKKVKSADADTNKANKENSIEPKEVKNEEKVEKLKFYVFFPNNYSGNYNEKDLLTKEEWQEKGFADRDWINYLLFGHDILIPNAEGSYNGYEMSNKGISTTSAIGVGIPTAVDPKTNISKIWNVYPDYEGEDKAKRIYYYRVDFDLRQKLREYENYRDTNSYQLNINQKNVSTVYSDADCSFTEFVGAVILSRIRKNRKDSTGEEYTFDDYVADDAPKLKYLIEKITNVYGCDESDTFEKLTKFAKIIEKGITKIKPIGGATEQDEKNSNVLAYRRCRTLGTYLKNILNFDGDIDFSKIEKSKKLLNDKTVNSKAAKLQRYAAVELYFGGPKIEDANDGTGKGSNVITTENKPKQDKNADTSESGQTKQEVHATVGNATTRYESEADYFNKLKTTDPLVFRKITDKYRYFDPAFHSLSPEGFNARLTFLHQCTRQGHTVSTADGKLAQTAGNLSFGRMPVCILRIGDFFYSKVIIQNMNISYESNNGIQWDLNPEGSGVQPMYAHISMTLTILGGQTLDGPSDRLQNANTFNFYANTGVYDDRSDRISVDSNGNLTYTNIFLPYNNEKKATTAVTTETKTELKQRDR